MANKDKKNQPFDEAWMEGEEPAAEPLMDAVKKAREAAGSDVDEYVKAHKDMDEQKDSKE